MPFECWSGGLDWNLHNLPMICSLQTNPFEFEIWLPNGIRIQFYVHDIDWCSFRSNFLKIRKTKYPLFESDQILQCVHTLKSEPNQESNGRTAANSTTPKTRLQWRGPVLSPTLCIQVGPAPTPTRTVEPNQTPNGCLETWTSKKS